MEENGETLLSLLEKQGQDFLAQFSTFCPHQHLTKPDPRIKPEPSSANDLEEDEWLGFSDAFSNCDAIPKVLKNHGEGSQVI